MPRNAVHPDDHRNHEDCGEQQHQAFEAVFADLPAFEGDGYGETQRPGHRNAGPNEARKMRPAGAGQINEYDANDQGGFDTFAESDEKSREHGSSC